MMDDEVPEGYHRAWVIETDRWRVGGDGHNCRRPRCENPAAAALRRPDRRVKLGFQWWYYCESHLYGRKIEDGILKVEILVKDEPA